MAADLKAKDVVKASAAEYVKLTPKTLFVLRSFYVVLAAFSAASDPTRGCRTRQAAIDERRACRPG